MTNPTMPTADEVRAVLIAGDPDEPECRLCGENYRMPAGFDPTPLCDMCAQKAVRLIIPILAQRDELAEVVEELMDFNTAPTVGRYVSRYAAALARGRELVRKAKEKK